MSQTLKAYPSPFNYASITPNTTLVGAYAMYTVTLIFLLDTEANSYL